MPYYVTFRQLVRVCKSTRADGVVAGSSAQGPENPYCVYCNAGNDMRFADMFYAQPYGQAGESTRCL